MSSSFHLRLANVLALLLLIPGSAAMIGHLTRNDGLKGFAMATAASPLPRVFGTAVHQESGVEFETFSARPELTYRDGDGALYSITVDRALMSRVTGPYNRRNAYGAVICYGPALPDAMRMSALRYALIRPGTMREALGLPEVARDLTISMQVKTATGTETFSTVVQ